jgi:hypothetical protein
MKATILMCLCLLSSSTASAQRLPEWYRLYTFDESIIEMNSADLTFGGKGIAQVRLRWTLDHPEKLSGEWRGTYKRREELIEFDCTERRYRPQEVKYFDSNYKLVLYEQINPEREWFGVTSAGMMAKILDSACEVITWNSPLHPSIEEQQKQKAAQYALLVARQLVRAKDFKPIVKKFFAPDFLDGYLRDRETDWFLNLDRDTAVRARRAELERYYIALLNSGFLTSLYVVSQIPPECDGPVANEKVIPSGLMELIKRHPYTSAYKGSEDNYDYLAEHIDSVERMRAYTDLLERIASLVRNELRARKSKGTEQDLVTLADRTWPKELFQPRIRTCVNKCLGLAEGTRLFEVDVPVLRLQLAEVKGELRVVSAKSSF